MTDKERLEFVKNSIDKVKKLWESDEYMKGDEIYISLVSEFDWIIQQAERAKELEEDLLELVKQNKELRKSIAFYSSESYNAHLERLLDRSEKQIKRYREALEEILAEAHEEAGVHPDTGMQLETYIVRIARKALEGESE